MAKKDPTKPAALRIDLMGQKKIEPTQSSIARPRPPGPTPAAAPAVAPAVAPAAPPAKPIQPILKPLNQPPEQAEIQNMDIVRRPRMPIRQGSKERVLEENKPSESKLPVIQPTKTAAPVLSQLMTQTNVRSKANKHQE